jgi:hypothetical protein
MVKNLRSCRKVSREMVVRTESLFSTELPFTRGSFTVGFRDTETTFFDPASVFLSTHW